MKYRICVLTMLAIAPRVFAHHSDVAFDMESIIVLEGTVTEFSWRNPHVYMSIAVPNGSGGSAEWQFQSHPTMVLTRSGWSRDSIRVGDVVTLRGHPDQNPERQQAILVSARTADGMPLEVNSDRDGEIDSVAADLNGRWRMTSESLGRLIEAFQATPFTESARAAMANTAR